MADNGKRQSKRQRRPTARDSSPPGGGKGKGQRTGKANKKRDDRSALVEAWMVKNENTGDKPSNEVKLRYADELKIPKEEFWDTMKKYALRSKYNCLPDFEQIFHHIKDDTSRVDVADLKMGQLDYWWEVEDDYYKPITANLKNFKPASGLLHHFYTVFIDNQDKYNAVRHHRLAAHRYKYQPEELEEMVKKLTPFRELPEPKALLVVPKALPQLRGTYALSKKISGNNIYIRPERKPVKGGENVTVVVNGTTLEVPMSKALNYATSENALVLYCKDEKRAGEGGGGGGDEGAESYRDVPLRLKVPGAQHPLEALIPSLHSTTFDIPEATIWPIRSLVPSYRIAGLIDYGAVWSGCFSPFPRTSVSYEEFAVQFSDFPQECFHYFFEAGEDASAHITSEDYIKFMSWFANFDEGLGQDNRNVLALYNALSKDHLPFSIRSQNEALRASQKTGAFVVRLCNTKPGYLTLEVLKEEEEGSPFAVLCFRIKVTFAHQPRAAFFGPVPPAVVMLQLESPDGSVLVTQEGSLAGEILKKVEKQSALPTGVKLRPLDPQLLSKGIRGLGATGGSLGALGSAIGGTGKRKHGGGLSGEEAIPPPISRLGASGIPSFNDPTFDMDGSQELAASMVEREASNTQVPTVDEAVKEEGGLNLWGHNIPLPEGGIGRDHSLNPYPTMGRDSSLSSQSATAAGGGAMLPPIPSAASVGRDMSFGALYRDTSLGIFERGHSLDGLGRDTSIGSIMRGESFEPFDNGTTTPANNISADVGSQVDGNSSSSSNQLEGPPTKRLRSST